MHDPRNAKTNQSNPFVTGIPKLPIIPVEIAATSADTILLSSISYTLQWYSVMSDRGSYKSQRNEPQYDLNAIYRLIETSSGERFPDVTPKVHNYLWASSYLFFGHALANAVDALYEAIDLGTIDPREAELSLQIQILNKDPTELLVTVEDNGVGISTYVLDSWRSGRNRSTRVNKDFLGGLGIGARDMFQQINEKGVIIIDTLSRTESSATSKHLEISRKASGGFGGEFSSSAKVKSGTTITMKLPLTFDPFKVRDRDVPESEDIRYLMRI